MIARGENILKVSVKGSKDGSWGLTQTYLKDTDYHRAIDKWLSRHKPKTIFCLVQFENTTLLEMPRLYLVTPAEIAERLKQTAKNRGDTILYERKSWGPERLQQARWIKFQIIGNLVSIELKQCLNWLNPITCRLQIICTRMCRSLDPDLMRTAEIS